MQIQVLQNSLSIPKLLPFPILFLAALCGQPAAAPQGAPCEYRHRRPTPNGGSGPPDMPKYRATCRGAQPSTASAACFVPLINIHHLQRWLWGKPPGARIQPTQSLLECFPPGKEAQGQKAGAHIPRLVPTGRRAEGNGSAW